MHDQDTDRQSLVGDQVALASSSTPAESLIPGQMIKAAQYSSQMLVEELQTSLQWHWLKV